ncbi:MAG: D-2-hydroxyacid dehydrogenase [Oscillospiraceae bacterium]|nr:D-2-hydroxyacid dehydrogenase [Oscillospiraceae bacterium]
MKLVITDAKTITQGDLSLAPLGEFAQLTIYENLPKEEYKTARAEADLLLCNKTRIDKELLDAAPSLKYVGLFATGYNNVDLSETEKRGITVCNAGSYSTDAVAQHTFALLLHQASRVADYNTFVQSGGWANTETFSPFVYPTFEIAGKNLGIIGYGAIGKQTAKLAEAFGMRVLVYTRTKKDSDVTYVSLEELLKTSDYITVHCPLNDQTRGLIGKEQLALCKKSAYLINTARGGVIDEKALAEAVKNKVIAGAAIDVLSKEPMAKDCPLLGVENITLTPHIAWAPLETRLRLLDIVKENIRAFLAGKPQNVVKP